MKKLLPTIFLATILALSFGCEEEECVSNCGTVLDDAITNGVYTLTIQNECSNNTEVFIVTELTWSNIYVGDFECVDNYTSW